VQVAQVDLANADQLDQFVMRLQALPAVACLVNNAGFGYIGDFTDLPLEKHLRMLDVHVTATVRLTYAVLPRMVEAGEGTLINVASLAAWTVGPGQAIYNSTKAFVKSFTEALHAEVEGTKIRVQALCPGITRTGFHDTEEFVGFDRSQMPNLWMSADEVVDESMAALRRNRPVCVPGFKNRVLAFLFGFNPIRRFAGKSVRKRPAIK
jgi:short-subunit dehydrogenase